jgi:hypothetical protein
MPSRPISVAPVSGDSRTLFIGTIVAIVCLAGPACRSSQPPPPSISFTRLPPSSHGSGDIVFPIAGRVTGARPEQSIVLFARAGQWWVQPSAAQPYTKIAKDTTWKADTHPGNAYAALLVDPGYMPPPTANSLPEPGGAIRAIAIADGKSLAHPEAKLLQFSGYDWAVRQTPPGRGPLYDADNVSVDRVGALHLQIAKKGEAWVGAQVELTRSLGHGSYRFVVRDVAGFEPAVVFALATVDETGPNHEIDIEISRWGESSGKNAQYTIQPYYIPANVVRFLAPSGRLTYSFAWQPGRVAFTTTGSDAGREGRVVAAHTFTSGIPSPGSEVVRLNLYAFYNERNPLQRDVEVVIEKFEFLP